MLRALRPNNVVIPYRGEFAAVWDGYIYPFRRSDTAEEFLEDLRAGIHTPHELSKFERYPC